MGQHDDEDLRFHVGDVKALPHTLAATHHLTLALIELNAAQGTAVFELHNPEAVPDAMVGGLIEAKSEDIDDENRWRDKLHLPDRAVPVDTSTIAVAVIHATLHERLQIGDRVWTVSEIAADSVTLTPGHDYEARSLVNDVAESGYQPEAIELEERLNAIDTGI